MKIEKNECNYQVTECDLKFGKQIILDGELLIPVSVLYKIMEEIDDEAEYAYADFDEYKYDVLHAEPDELPDDDFRYGLRRAIEIINKYKAESEDTEWHTGSILKPAMMNLKK